jgi:glutamate-1-semialdehyde 2,1-aminomutase
LKQPGFYEELERKSTLLVKGIAQAASKAGITIQLPNLGSMFTVFFARETAVDYDTALKADTELYAKFFHGMLSQGIYLPPSQFETAFVSTAHTDNDIQATIDAASKTFSAL